MSALLAAESGRQAPIPPRMGLQPGQAASSSLRLNAGSCIECGGIFERIGSHGAFCSSRCRMAWNNRRRDRGAEIYDLFMTIRFDRPRAKALALWTALCRAAALFRQADVDERAGRRSWAAPEEVLARKPYLRSKILVRKSREQRGG